MFENPLIWCTDCGLGSSSKGELADYVGGRAAKQAKAKAGRKVGLSQIQQLYASIERDILKRTATDLSARTYVQVDASRTQQRCCAGWCCDSQMWSLQARRARTVERHRARSSFEKMFLFFHTNRGFCHLSVETAEQSSRVTPPASNLEVRKTAPTIIRPCREKYFGLTCAT